MKTTKFFISFVAIFNIAIFSTCAQTVKEMQDSLEVIKAKYELLKAQHELDSLQRVMSKPSEPDCFNIPDTSPDYIIQQAEGEDLFNRQTAYHNAVVEAKLMIAEKWMGFVKNFSKEYYSRTNEPNDNIKEKFERMVQTAGETVINKFVPEIRYPKFRKSERGTVVCCVTLRVPVVEIETVIENDFTNALSDIQKELSGLKIDMKALKQSYAKANQERITTIKIGTN